MLFFLKHSSEKSQYVVFCISSSFFCMTNIIAYNLFILECKLVHTFSVPNIFIWINKTTKLQKLIYRVPLYCQFSLIPCSVKILNWRRIADTSWMILAYFQTRVMNHKYSCSEFIHWENWLQRLINNITALPSLQRKESNFPSISKYIWRQDQRSAIILSYPP